MRTGDVVVVGAGVVGLTTAIALAERGFPVTVLSAEPPEETTSAVAGATWFPYEVDPPERVTAWTGASRRTFDELADLPGTGVRLRECHQLWRSPADREPWWSAAVPDLHRLPENELPPGFADSYAFVQPVIDMRAYLPYLRERLGTPIRYARLGSLEEAGEYGELVVNCTGVAAGALVPDAAVHPVRGHCVRVRNPGIERVLADFGHPHGEAYIIPHEDSCILGGTTDAGAWDTSPRERETADILARCAELDGRIAGAAVIGAKLGLRPARRGGVRLELDRLPDGKPCVHNYGHGGAGVTLSWGCAEEIVEVLR